VITEKEKSQWHDCQNCPAFKTSFISSISNQHRIDLKEHAPILVFRKGQKIKIQEENSQGAYCIRSGLVKLFHKSKQDTKITLGFRKPGNLIGHHGIMVGKNILSASCLTPVEVCFFTRKTILNKAKEYPELLEKIHADVMDDMQEMIYQLSNSYTKSIEHRLIEAILKMEETFNTTDDGFIALPLTRQELSEFIGASIESVFRSLAALKAKKLIEVKKEQIKILDKCILLSIKNNPRNL
jgi:CRP-like cAMP-binding protein